MASGFRMNPDFPSEIRRQLQKALDRVFDRYAGQPVETVQAALEREGLRSDGSEDLTSMAAAISSGKRVRVHAA